MPDPQPLFLSQTINARTMADTVIQQQFSITNRWIVRNAVPASGTTPSQEMTRALSSLRQLDDEMFHRTQQSYARSPLCPQAAAARNRRSAFADRIRTDPEYSAIFDRNWGDEPIGFYRSQRYFQGGFLFRPDQYIEWIGRVYDLEGSPIWMTEIGIEEPMVDPVSVLVDSFSGGSGSVGRRIVSGDAAIPQGAAEDAVLNSARSTMRTFTARVIPNRVYQNLIAGVRRFYQ